MTRPVHPWMVLCGQVNCLRALFICLQRAQSLVKSGVGAKVGGCLRYPMTSSYAIRVSILQAVWDLGDQIIKV
jgi:hypothetical protein